MNKIKLFIASMLGAIALVFACVLGTRVNAETGTYYDKTFDSSASNTGWTYSDVSSNSSFDDAKNTYNDSTTAVSVGKLSENKVIKSPTFAKEASQIVVTVYVGTTGSNNGLPFLIKGYNGDDLITTVTGYTPKSKVLGCACSDANNTAASTGFTISNTANQTYTRFEITHTQAGKGLCFVEVDYSTTDAVAKTVTSISATNKTTYYVGDTFASSGFEVTATYSDSTNAVLASSKYTVTVKNSNDESVTGAFEATGSYTATIVLDEDNTISTSCNFTVSATYTITYYLDGVLEHTDSSAKAGSKITYKPTLDNQGFDGWYTDSNCTEKLASDFTVSENKTLYAKTIALTYVLTNAYVQNEHGNYGTDVLTSDTDYLNNTIFKATKGCQFGTSSSTYGGATYNYLIKTNGASYNSTNKRTIEFVAPSDGFVTIWVASNSNDTRVVKLYKDDVAVTGCEQGFAVAKKIYEVIWEVEAGATYDIGATNGVMFYNVSFGTSIADSVTLAFDSQYDADGTAATKLRFIGTIEGLATTEYTKIETITFTFDFNGVNDRALSVTQLYLSITGYDQYAAASNKMYFVYQLDNINKVAYAGLKLTDCKLTVVFTDGSSKTITHADITLPAFE